MSSASRAAPRRSPASRRTPRPCCLPTASAPSSRPTSTSRSLRSSRASSSCARTPTRSRRSISPTPRRRPPRTTWRPSGSHSPPGEPAPLEGASPARSLRAGDAAPARHGCAREWMRPGGGVANNSWHRRHGQHGRCTHTPGVMQNANVVQARTFGVRSRCLSHTGCGRRQRRVSVGTAAMACCHTGRTGERSWASDRVRSPRVPCVAVCRAPSAVARR
mmetsp:Transcript_66866/g.183405  ORF Transcript_66866/g.183405 Transcript_66866/m.183405 type:complete len:219 (+) Transcript_66866:701-1357(+)